MKFQMQFKSVSKYIKMSPNKVRRVLRQIKGKDYVEALKILKFLPYSACKVIAKTLQSAAANALNQTKPSKLSIENAFADQGSMVKKTRARAKGRANKILNLTSTITIILKLKNN